jgi:hypothetical protein
MPRIRPAHAIAPPKHAQAYFRYFTLLSFGRVRMITASIFVAGLHRFYHFGISIHGIVS